MIWVALDKWGARVATLVSYAVIARLLSLHELGIGAIVLSAGALVQLVADGGVATALIRHPRLNAGLLHTAFWTNMLLGAAATALLIAVSPLMAFIYGEPALVGLIALMAIKMPIVASASVPMAVLQRRQKFRAMSMRRILGNLVGAAVGIGAALAGAGVWAIVLQALASSIVATSVLWFTVSYRPKPYFRLEEMRGLLAFGLSAMLSSALTVLTGPGLMLVVGLVMTSSEVGLFSLANQLVSVAIDVLANAVGVVALPRLVRARLQQSQSLQDEFDRATRTVSYLCAVSLGALSVSAPWVLTLLFGSSRADAAPYLVALCVAGYIASLQPVVRSLLHAEGRSGVELGLNGAQTAVQLVSVGIAGPFGPIAVAWALTLRSLVASITGFIAVRRIANISLASSVATFVRGGAVAGALGIAITVLLRNVSVTAITSIVVPISALVAFAVILALTVSASECRSIISAIWRRLRMG